jgi:hypothetical protein
VGRIIEGVGGHLLPGQQEPVIVSASCPSSHPVLGVAPIKTNNPAAESLLISSEALLRTSIPSRAASPMSPHTSLRGDADERMAFYLIDQVVRH